jgi:hypothetical protein
MKNVFKVLGIIAIVAVIGFSMVSCGEDPDKGGIDFGNAPSFDGTWKLSSSTIIISGDNFTYGNFNGTLGKAYPMTGSVSGVNFIVWTRDCLNSSYSVSIKDNDKTTLTLYMGNTVEGYFKKQ